MSRLWQSGSTPPTAEDDLTTGDRPDEPIRKHPVTARVLTALGRAQRGEGHPILATRSFTAALDLCDGHDENLADEVRALLAEKTPRRRHSGEEHQPRTT